MFIHSFLPKFYHIFLLFDNLFALNYKHILHTLTVCLIFILFYYYYYLKKKRYSAAVSARVRLGSTPSSGGTYNHSVTLSSISKLTESHESMPGVRKPSDDDYLVVDEDFMSKSHESSMPSSRQSSAFPETSPSSHQQLPRLTENSVSPIVGNSPSKPQDGLDWQSEDPLPSSREPLPTPSSKSLAIVTILHGKPKIISSSSSTVDKEDY